MLYPEVSCPAVFAAPASRVQLVCPIEGGSGCSGQCTLCFISLWGWQADAFTHPNTDPLTVRGLSSSLRFAAAFTAGTSLEGEEQVWELWVLLCPIRKCCQPEKCGRRAPLTHPCPRDSSRVRSPGAERSTGVRREKCIHLPTSERNSWKGSRANDFLWPLLNTLGVINKLCKMLQSICF